MTRSEVGTHSSHTGIDGATNRRIERTTHSNRAIRLRKRKDTHNQETLKTNEISMETPFNSPLLFQENILRENRTE